MSRGPKNGAVEQVNEHAESVSAIVVFKAVTPR